MRVHIEEDGGKLPSKAVLFRTKGFEFEAMLRCGPLLLSSAVSETTVIGSQEDSNDGMQ